MQACMLCSSIASTCTPSTTQCLNVFESSACIHLRLRLSWHYHGSNVIAIDREGQGIQHHSVLLPQYHTNGPPLHATLLHTPEHPCIQLSGYSSPSLSFLLAVLFLSVAETERALHLRAAFLLLCINSTCQYSSTLCNCHGRQQQASSTHHILQRRPPPAQWSSKASTCSQTALMPDTAQLGQRRVEQ